MTDININPENGSSLLLELVKGQERAAEALKNQNTLLFGGDGHKGALPYILEQHEKLLTKIEDTRTELATKVESTRTELATKVETARTELASNQTARDTKVDDRIDGLTDKHNALDKKVNWAIGVGTGIGAAVTTGLAYLGIRRG